MKIPDWLMRLFKRRRAIGHSTRFRANEAYVEVLTGRMTIEEFSRADLSDVTTPIYALAAAEAGAQEGGK